jgi:Cys-tRNA(Pro) deacylase
MSHVRDSSNCMPSTILVPDRDKALHINAQSLFSIFRNSIMSRHDTHAPETPATRFLRQHGMAYSSHLYDYEDHGGTAVSARELNVNEHAVIKTLIMEDENAQPLIVLMHGDRKVSTKELARQIGCKRVETCKPETANRHTGYLVGGTSPFGTRKPMPVYIERTVLDLALVYINGGRRGYLVGIHPHDLLRVLQAKLVDVAN